MYFQEAEAARQQLDKTCKEFFNMAEPSGIAKMFGLRKKKSRAAANEVLQEYIASDIKELHDVVNGIEVGWRKKQSKASRRASRTQGDMTLMRRSGVRLLAKTLFESSCTQARVCSLADPE